MAEVVWGSGYCRGSRLTLDQACFHIVSLSSDPVTLFNQSEECYMCKFIEWTKIPAKGNISLVVDTTFPVSLYFESNEMEWCHTTYRFEEHGQYTWNVTHNGCSHIEVLEKPNNIYIPIVVAFVIYMTIGILWNLLRRALKSEWLAQLRERMGPFSELQDDLGSPTQADAPTLVRSELLPTVRLQKVRIVSLDAFRGLCLAIMIFVNAGGGHYYFFKHSVWNGVTFADLVFPWFLWIMGVGLVISLRNRLRSSLQRKHLFVQVVRRAGTLIVLGLVLNTMHGEKTDLNYLRFPGVLQLIGVASFMVGTTEAVFIKAQGAFQYGRWLVVQDVLDSWMQWLAIIILTVTHVVVTFLLPVPNCPTGYLGPGGLHFSLTRGDEYANCTGGASGYIDRLVFGSNHLYQHPTFSRIYQTTMTFDPEGLLGTFTTAVLLVYLGVQAGRVMLCYHYTSSRMARWMMWALITGLSAGILCNFSKDDGWIPVNKNLWSLSYVLAMSSLACVVLSLLYFVIDDRHWWSGSPFTYAGMNSLVLYVGSEMTRKMFPWSWKPVYNTHAELLAMDLWSATLWVLIAYLMHRKNLFIVV